MRILDGRSTENSFFNVYIMIKELRMSVSLITHPDKLTVYYQFTILLHKIYGILRSYLGNRPCRVDPFVHQ